MSCAGRKMNRSDKHFKESVLFAAAMAVFAFSIYFIQQLVGFDKMNPGATPKTFSEVVTEWPRLLGLAVAFFLGTLWWRLSQKEKETFICSRCQEPVDRETESDVQKEITCQKCGGKMEQIEGYYDRHPDRR